MLWIFLLFLIVINYFIIEASYACPVATNDPKYILRNHISPKGHTLVRKADKYTNNRVKHEQALNGSLL